MIYFIKRRYMRTRDKARHRGRMSAHCSRPRLMFCLQAQKLIFLVGAFALVIVCLRTSNGSTEFSFAFASASEAALFFGLESSRSKAVTNVWATLRFTRR